MQVSKVTAPKFKKWQLTIFHNGAGCIAGFTIRTLLINTI